MLDLSFSKLPFHHLWDVIPHVLGLPPLCRENLVPQVIERVLVKVEILVHSPTDLHLQNGGEVDMSHLAPPESGKCNTPAFAL